MRNEDVMIGLRVAVVRCATPEFTMSTGKLGRENYCNANSLSLKFLVIMKHVSRALKDTPQVEQKHLQHRLKYLKTYDLTMILSSSLA